MPEGKDKHGDNFVILVNFTSNIFHNSATVPEGKHTGLQILYYSFLSLTHHNKDDSPFLKPKISLNRPPSVLIVILAVRTRSQPSAVILVVCRPQLSVRFLLLLPFSPLIQ